MTPPVAAIGVDGGGTSLRIHAVDRRGRTLLERAVPGVPVAELPGVLRDLLSGRGLAGAPVLVVGSRGVWLPAERAALRAKLRGLAGRVVVLSDVELAHALFFRGGPGILLIAGTGSIGYGRSGRRIGRAGGLGPAKGDEGSGSWIGRRLLEATGKPLAGRSAAALAALAPGVLRGAQAGRPKAVTIARDAARHLAALAVAVAAKLRPGAPLRVALHGGLFADAWFRRRCIAAIRRDLPGARIAPTPRGCDAAGRAARMGLDGSSGAYARAANPPR